MRVEPDILYIFGGEPRQSLDLYLPEATGDQPLPVLVWIHGGSWRGGSKRPCPATDFVSRGYAVASIEYRYSHQALFPAQIQDCQAAIRWLRANSKKYNLDAEHIGAWGVSAGGHLVALLGTTGGKKVFPPVGGNEEQSDRVQAVCDFCGPTNFSTIISQAAAGPEKNVVNFNTSSDPYFILIGEKLGENAGKAARASPVTYADKNASPFLILHGTHDPAVPFAQSLDLADALRRAGADVTIQRLAGAGHSGPAFSLPSVKKLIQDFFDKHLKSANVKIEPVSDSDLNLAGQKVT